MHKPAKPPAKPSAPGKEVIQVACDDAALRARQEILTRLGKYQTDNDLSYKATVLAFVLAVKAASQEKLSKSYPHYVQIAGFGLPYAIIRDAKGWNAKREAWQISARSVYSWKSLLRENSDAKAPSKVKIAKGAADELIAVIQFLGNAPDHHIDLVAQFCGRQLADALRRAGWVVQSEPVQSKR